MHYIVYIKKIELNWLNDNKIMIIWNYNTYKMYLDIKCTIEFT